MKKKILGNALLSFGIILALMSVLPDRLSGVGKAPPPRYTLIDLGTLGGPNSGFNGLPPAMINSAGNVAAGQADTSTPCSFPDPFSDGFVSPAFMWVNGTL